MKLRGQSGEKKQSWQTYKVTLSDEASFQEEDNEVYGKPVQFSSNSGEKTKSKWIKNKKGRHIFNKGVSKYNTCFVILKMQPFKLWLIIFN